MEYLLNLVGSFALGMVVAWAVQAAGRRVRLLLARSRLAAGGPHLGPIGRIDTEGREEKEGGRPGRGSSPGD